MEVTGRIVGERRRIGLGLHEAETAIHIGRMSVQAEREQVPVDEVAVQQQMLAVSEARVLRNDLRHQLAISKAADIRRYDHPWRVRRLYAQQ